MGSTGKQSHTGSRNHGSKSSRGSPRPRKSALKSKRSTKKNGSRRGGRSIAPRLVLLVATRKGLWIHRRDRGGGAFRIDGPHFLGHVVSHAVLDPRDRRTLLVAAKTGHLGP